MIHGAEARVRVALALMALVGVLAHAALAASPIDVAVAARSLQPGELAVLTITCADRLRGVRVRVFGEDIPTFEKADHAWVALVGIDLGRTPGRYRAVVEAHVDATTLHASQLLVVQPKRFPTRTLLVDPSFVNPSAADLVRIEADAALIRDVYARSASERLWSGTMVRPVPGPATSRFGARSIFNGEARRPHGGADFLSPAGTLVKAPLAGRIAAARDLYFTGQTVIVDHGLGVFSLMAHLSAIDVQEGDVVAAGQPLGLVGATGRVTGPHLHWALTVSGARVDPMSALALLGHE